VVGVNAWPQLLQNLEPGLLCEPQLVQKAWLGTVAAAAVSVCILWPQLVQNALLFGTSAWQAMHWRVAGWETTVTGAETAAIACAASELPQCIQKAALAFTVPEQRGQMVVAASTACTGVPQSGQNFLSVISRPQFVQLAMAFPLKN